MLSEDHLLIDTRRIKQNIKKQDGTVKVETEKNWLMESKDYKKIVSPLKFDLYQSKKGSDRLYLENNNLNLMVSIIGDEFSDLELKSKWIDRWLNDLKVLFDLFILDNKEILKYVGEWNNDFEIYRNILGQKEMGATTLDEIALKYEGWYCFKFDFGFEVLFRNKKMKERLNELHVFNVSIHYDIQNLVIFLNDFTLKELNRIFKLYNFLRDNLVDLNKKVNDTKEMFFKDTKLWELI